MHDTLKICWLEPLLKGCRGAGFIPSSVLPQAQRCPSMHNPANEPLGEQPSRPLPTQTKAPVAKRMPRSRNETGPSSIPSVPAAERPRPRSRVPAAKRMPRYQQSMSWQNDKGSYMHSSAGRPKSPLGSPVGFIPSSALPQAYQQGFSTHWHLPLGLPECKDRLPQLMREVNRANIVMISGGIHRDRAAQSQKFWKLFRYTRTETCKIHLKFMYKMRRWGRSRNNARLTARDPSVYAEVSTHQDFENCLEESKTAYYSMQERNRRNKKAAFPANMESIDLWDWPNAFALT